jgi:hypothetical protein
VSSLAMLGERGSGEERVGGVSSLGMLGEQFGYAGGERNRERGIGYV